MSYLEPVGRSIESPVFVYTVDHGIAFPRAKITLYDPGLATALILRWPYYDRAMSDFPVCV